MTSYESTLILSRNLAASFKLIYSAVYWGWGEPVFLLQADNYNLSETEG